MTEAAPELTMTRVFAAPRERVWAAWTEPDEIRAWMCPNGFEVTHSEGDLAPGGAWRMAMRSDEWGELWLSGVYRELDPPQRLVFTTAWEEADAPWHEMLITVTLAEHPDGTEMTFHQAVFQSADSRDSHRDGWGECFDRLHHVLADPATA